MQVIDKSSVFAVLNDGETRRKQFSYNSGVQKNKASPTFSVPFDNGLCDLFYSQTLKRLTYKASYKQHYCFLRTQEDIDQAEAWEAQQGTRVFLRNCLTTSLALDYNFVDNSSGQKTHIGALEEAAKHHAHEASVAELVGASLDTIKSIPHLAGADCICAVPATADKGWDLPTRLAADIAQYTGWDDVTPHLTISNKNKSLKECSLEEKWDAWEEVDFEYSGPSLDGRRVILIDDKYQSGVTQQFVGMRLQQFGCAEVHGLCMVKTLRDTDNVSLVDV